MSVQNLNNVAFGLDMSADTVWDDIRVPTTATKRGGSKDPDFVRILDNGSGSQGLFAELFSPSTEEELYFNVQMPHAWKFGTPLLPHVHWLPTNDGTSGQTVSWGLEYSIVPIGTIAGDSTIIYADTHIGGDAILLSGKHHLTPFTGIDMSAVVNVSCMLICRVFRDATGTGGTDDYASDAALIEIDFHYELDSVGSDGEFTK